MFVIINCKFGIIVPRHTLRRVAHQILLLNKTTVKSFPIRKLKARIDNNYVDTLALIIPYAKVNELRIVLKNFYLQGILS